VKLLVTGATGFLGGALAQLLAERGHQVRALVRKGRDTERLERLGVEVVRGDLLDGGSLRAAVTGVDGLFHAAAVYSYSFRNTRELYRTNVDSVNSLFGAAKTAGVRRAVFTSTVATFRWPGHGALADEACTARAEDLPGHYKKSKFLGEQAALSYNSPGFEVVVVNPTAPFGPGDARPTPTGRIVLEYLRSRFPGYVYTGMNVCDVEDVAHGHLAAFERGRPGERYILGGMDNLTLAGIYDALRRATGVRRLPVRVPYALAFAAGLIDSVIEGVLLRREPYIPVEGLRVARHPMFVTCRKAISELGLPQRPAVESLERAARWYADNGYTRVRIRAAASAGNTEAAR
jgi:dihydroflavonol-4-reductase